MFTNIIQDLCHLVMKISSTKTINNPLSSWWLSHPFEIHGRQIRSFPRNRDDNKKSIIYIYTSPPSLPLPLLPSAPTSFLSLLLDGLIVSGSLACRSPTGPWDVRIMAGKGLCPPQTFSKKKCPENGPNPPKTRAGQNRLFVGESAVFFPIFGSWSFEKWPRNACLKGTERYEN